MGYGNSTEKEQPADTFSTYLMDWFMPSWQRKFRGWLAKDLANSTMVAVLFLLLVNY